MDNLTQLISVPIITAICYGVIEIYKYATSSNEKFLRLIPVIAAVLGTALGIVAFYCAKSMIAADNILTAMLIGLSSGLAATGTNQIFKQLTKGGSSAQQGDASQDATQKINQDANEDVSKETKEN